MPSASGSGSGSDRDRARADRGSVRALFLLIAVVLGALALGVAFAPQGLDVVLDEPPPATESPPPAGDRDPDRRHPDDPGSSTYEGGSVTIDSNAVEEHVHREVNDRRAEHGREPIDWDGTVASVSRAHSVDMYERDYVGHENPDGDGPIDRFDEVGNYCRGYGENVAVTWVDADVRRADGDGIDRYETAAELAAGLVDQWMRSPPHREVILEDWDRGGVGVYLTAEGRVFATHNFCLESTTLP